MTNKTPLLTANIYYRKKFGKKVFRIPLHGNFTCPNRDGTKGKKGCTFCNSRGSLAPFTDENLELEKQINSGIQRHGDQDCLFVAYFQSFSNTYAPSEKLLNIYQIPLQFNRVAGIAIGTRPDCITAENVQILKQLKSKTDLWVELGLQTIHDKTLDKINRGHTYGDFLKGFELLKKNGIKTCIHVIFGLPGENISMMQETIHTISKLPIDGIKLHHLHILRNSQMEEDYRLGKIELIGQNDYINLAVELLNNLPPDVVLFRLMGDAPEKDLVAPSWTLEKQKILQEIRNRLDT